MKKVILFLIASSIFQLYAQQASWKFNFGKNSNLIKPLIYKGFAYLVSDEGILSVVDLKNGKLAWSFKADAPLSLPPVIENDVAFFCTKNGDVIAMDLITKKVKWTKNAGDKLICTPLIYKEKVIVYSKNFIMAYDKIVGLDFWKTDLKISGKPSLMLVDDFFYFADNMKVYAVNCNTGKIAWEFSLPVYGQSEICVANDKIYIINKDKLYCIDRVKGTEIFKKEISSEFNYTFLNTPVVHENQLFISIGNELILLTADKGTEVWRIKLKSQNELMPVVLADNKIYVPERSNLLHVYLPEKGKKEYSFTLTEKIESEVVIENQILYFTTSDGNLVSFKLIQSK